MANKGIPPSFVIGNEGEIAGIFAGEGCTKISFDQPGPLTKWSVVPLDEGYFGFQQSETGYWATAVNGQVLACPEFNNQGQSTFWVVRNNDGTYLVALNTTRIVWTVKDDGSLGLGPAISGPNNSFHFIEA